MPHFHNIYIYDVRGRRSILFTKTKFCFVFSLFHSKTPINFLFSHGFSDALFAKFSFVSFLKCCIPFPFFFFSDPRVNDWIMMSSPFPTVAICLSYAFLSKFLGPKLMENRKPFNLRRTLIIYNLVQTLFSTWIFYEVRFISILFLRC